MINKFIYYLEKNIFFVACMLHKIKIINNIIHKKLQNKKFYKDWNISQIFCDKNH